MLATVLLSSVFCAGVPENGRTDKDLQTGSASKFRLEFEESTWEEVLQFLAKKSGLGLHMTLRPPGRFSYHDERLFDAVGAHVLIHGVLLDRGVTLVKRHGLLLVLSLAEQLHWELAPFVAADQLAQEADPHRIVATTFALHRLTPQQAVRDLENLMGPRGRIVALPHTNRVAAWDRASSLEHLRRTLTMMDQPDEKIGQFRVFRFTYIRAEDARRVILQLVGGKAEAPAGPVDFAKMGRELGNSEMLSAFIPGFSFKGMVPDAPSDPVPTRLSIDGRRNTLLAWAEADVLARIARIIENMDLPVKSQAEEIVEKQYRVDADGDQIAERLRNVFEAEANVTISGEETVVLVRAPQSVQKQVARIVSRTRKARTQVVILPVPPGQAPRLKALFDKLYESIESENRPSFAADDVGHHLVVRGTPQQVEHVAQALQR